MKYVQKSAREENHAGTLINGKRLAKRFAADGKAGDQRRDPHAQKHCVYVQHSLELDHNDGGGCAGDNAANVAHHVVAEAADMAGIMKKANGFRRSRLPVGRHGVERPFVRGGNSHADDVKYNAKTDEHSQDQQRRRDPRSGEHAFGSETQHGGQRHGDQKYSQNPAILRQIRVVLLFYFSLAQTAASSAAKIPPRPGRI
ncbi:hypothetical protein SDC9_122990 [bioreactor metagenome]|uniref:Uncharacterized protein n=1 Tax=bioreactor metagenome TaxID=1076179 RepID=A0A645CGF6_9ZZZZ